jgi:uncharacterized protein (DUF58 family)
MSQIFQYRLKGASSSVFVGKHASQSVNNGQLFKRFAPLTANSNPRRIDLKASVLDPFEQYQIRTYQQHSVLDVYLLADFSNSFRFVGSRSKQQILEELFLSIAYSALAVGDYFAFIGIGQKFDKRYFLPANRHSGRIESFRKRLNSRVENTSINGLLEIAPYLSKRRSLVFLLSDFHVELSTLPKLLHSLKHHDVVPMILWDENEYQKLPALGFVSFQDMETKTVRTLFMRPTLREKIENAYQKRRQNLQNSLRALGCEPLFLTTAPLTQQLNDYFRQRHA